MERPPPFQQDQYFSARPPQQQQPPPNPEFPNQESSAHFFNSGTRGDMFPRNRTSAGLDLSMHGAFQRSELQNPGEIHGSGAGGSFWPRQDVYRHQQQFPHRDQRFTPNESDRSAALQPPPYGSPFYHLQGDHASNPGAHGTMDLSKTMHPAFSEIPGQSGPDQVSQVVGNAPQMEFSYRQQPPTVSGCQGNLWQPNNNYSTQMQTQFGDPRYNRAHKDDPSSYGNIGPFHNQSGPAIPNNFNYQKQHHPEASQYNFSESTLSEHHRGQQEMHWHWKETSTTSRHQKDFAAQPDSEARQAQQDQQWIAKFLSKKSRKVSKVSCPKQSERTPLVSEARDAVYSAARLVSELTRMCQVLKQNVENESLWSESCVKALAVKKELQEKLKTLDDPVYIEDVKKKLARIRKKRSRLQRKKREQALEKQEEEARAAEREAQIDKWRMKCVQQVEEKKREQELKAAADSVLSEVRKKQADSKRMMDILRSLEKLRKLRKEAAARKGIHPEATADEAFEQQVAVLRKVIVKRTVVYDAEEKALRVMLEGEQEEERKRELERKHKKEKEKVLQRKRHVESMLFGNSAEMHPEHPLRPFRHYYLQAEHSLHALMQIRRDWDCFLVPADHPDGSFIPQGWVLPVPPSNDVWATALEKPD